MRRPMRPLALFLSLLLAAACGSDEEARDEARITIESPAHRSFVATQRVRVRGSAQGASSIEVNGKRVEVVGGAWEIALDFGEGVQEVTARAGAASAVSRFEVDTRAPALALTSPERGSYLGEQRRVSVRGASNDGEGSGVAIVRVNGAEIAAEASGAFATELPVEPGAALIVVEAIDRAGNTARAVHGVMVGPTVPADAPDRGSVSVVADKDVFALASRAIESLLTPERARVLVEAQLGTEGLTIEALSFAPLSVRAVPRPSPAGSGIPGHLGVSLKAREVDFAGGFTLLGQGVGLEVSLSSIEVSLDVTPRSDGAGGLTFTIERGEVTIPDGALSWRVRAGFGELSSAQSEALSELVERIVRVAFVEATRSLVLSDLWDPGVLAREFTLFGRTVGAAFTIDDLRVIEDAIALTGSLRPTTPAAPEVRAVPGALLLGDGTPSGAPWERPLVATAPQRALGRVLHALWASGLFHQRLEEGRFAGYELPFAFTTSALSLALDGRINDLAPQGSPIAIALRPQLPPTLALAPEADRLIMRVAELHLDVLIGQAPGSLLATFALALDLELAVSIEEGELVVDVAVSEYADLIEEPLLDLDDESSETLFSSIAALVPVVLSDALRFGAEADLGWVKIERPALGFHGVPVHQVSLGADLAPGALLAPAR